MHTHISFPTPSPPPLLPLLQVQSAFLTSSVLDGSSRSRRSGGVGMDMDMTDEECEALLAGVGERCDYDLHRWGH